MNDFIIAVLPFLIIGLCLAIICTNMKKEKSTYCSEGMCMGMCVGVALSVSLHVSMGLGISLGMLIGETIGILIEKK